MENIIKKNESRFWKTIALLLLGILIGIFCFKFVFAINWPADKNQTCNLFNKNGTACDELWCNSILGGNYSIPNGLCIFNVTISNQTNTTNSTNVTYDNFTSVNYFNKSELANFTCELIKNITGYGCNETNVTIKQDIINMGSSTYQAAINQTEQRIMLNQPYSTSNSNNSGVSWSWWGFAVVLGIVFVFIGFLVYQQSHKKLPVKAQSFRNTIIEKAKKTKGNKEEEFEEEQ
jgi:hypothetical protein